MAHLGDLLGVVDCGDVERLPTRERTLEDVGIVVVVVRLLGGVADQPRASRSPTPTRPLSAGRARGARAGERRGRRRRSLRSGKASGFPLPLAPCVPVYVRGFLRGFRADSPTRTRGFLSDSPAWVRGFPSAPDFPAWTRGFPERRERVRTSFRLPRPGPPDSKLRIPGSTSRSRARVKLRPCRPLAARRRSSPRRLDVRFQPRRFRVSASTSR
jgi:hypothetical protein